MLRQRLSDVVLEANSPFLSTNAGIGNFLSNMDSYYLNAKLKEDKINEGITRLLIESSRAKQFGFTETELERYKKLLLNNADLRQKETGKISTKYYVEQYIDNFTDAKPIPSDAFVYQFYTEVFPSITVQDVNNIATEWVRDDNMTVLLKAVEKSDLKLPTEREIESILTQVKTKSIEPYKDELGDIQLMPEKPKPGKVLKETYNKKINTTTWELSNGITVVVKPTEFQNDLISLNGFRPGGSSVAPDSLYVSARNASSIIGASGVNGISDADLKKLNMGENPKA
ncbi:probable zinc protease pqqL [Algibacter lectus]|uniref:Probable zinc protease pqqL n=1 Tax=Algibacter lectus TaxID=221126 RepID=A0A090WVQ3_9FLAO|nr:probable zinc protease pqqL [Algibacter lectus]